MAKRKTGSELPTIKQDISLPYVPLWSGFRLLDKIAFLVFGLSGGITIIVSGYNDNPAVFSFLVLITVISALGFLFFVCRNFRYRLLTKRFLYTHDEELLKLITEKYGVTMTPSLLYSLAQGGVHLIPDNTGTMIPMLLHSDKEAKITYVATTA